MWVSWDLRNLWEIFGKYFGKLESVFPKEFSHYHGKRPQTVWGSGRIMYHNVDDEDDMMRMMMMRIMLRTMVLRIMMLRMMMRMMRLRMMTLRRTTDPKTGDDTFASMCSRNAGGHFTRATSCESLQVKCRRPRPGTTLCASLRNRNARGHLTIWWFQVIPLPYTHAHTHVYIYMQYASFVCSLFLFMHLFLKF